MQTAHSRFPTYILNSYSRLPLFLCGDPAHLLKRERNLVYSTRSPRRFLYVDDGHGLVRLNWQHICALRAEDVMASKLGLPEQKPFLKDRFVQLNSWGKMSVPGALAVYGARVIAALRLKGKSVTSDKEKRELLALARHL